jgi:cell division protein FtsQ
VAGSAPPAANTEPMASLARRRTRVVLAAAVLLAVATPLALWLRNSSLVRVERVTVTGIHGPQASAIRGALTEAALDMTVLHVRGEALRTAVEPYPVVRGLRTQTDFPHGLRIIVNAYEPIAALQAGTRLTAVAADGTVLRGAPTRALPVVRVGATPGGDRTDDARALGAIDLLAAAPPALRERVARIYRGPRGIAATVQNGPKLYFGGAARFDAKWMAAAQVLAQRSSRGASYVDLRVPERPVAGGLQPRQAQDSTSTLG